MYAAATSQRASWLLLMSIFSISLIASTQAAAQPGTLDPTFGTGGIVTTAFPLGGSFNVATGNAVTIQPDGKILVCGGVPGSDDFPVAAVVRYNTDGSLDMSFGNAGIAVTQNISSLNVITLQANGQIVVAGPPGSAIIEVARFNSNGNLDTTFGTAGIFTSKAPIDAGGPSGGVVVQPDGNIVVAEGLMLRLLPDGALDTSFGTGGYATTAGYSSSALALLSDGKILAASSLSPSASSISGYVTRYNSNGSLDTSFGVNGQLATAGSGNAMVVLSKGELVVGGSLTSSLSGPVAGFAVSRYKGIGVTDATFASHGGVVTPVPNFPTVVTAGLGVQSSGDIVVLGTASAYPNFAFGLARYTPTGQVDSTFGTNGTVTTSFGTTSLDASGLAIQSNSDIVTVGSFQINKPQGGSTGFVLARYLGQ
jgi:uncharacterized delta-60 repeat protein